MIRSYWNALRVGDNVVVHDDTDPDFAIAIGTVAAIHSRKPTNMVTVRLIDASGSVRISHPKRLAVHLALGDSPGECWRCDEPTRHPEAGTPGV